MRMVTTAASRAPGLIWPFGRDNNSFSVSASGTAWPSVKTSVRIWALS